MSKPNAHADFNTLINAPKFSNDPIGQRQKKRWQLMAADIYQSTTVEALLEARGKAKGYITASWMLDTYRPRTTSATT